MLLIGGAGVALIVTAALFLAYQGLWDTFIGVACAFVALALVGWVVHAPRRRTGARAIGVGTVRTVSDDVSTVAAGERRIMIEVASVHGEMFIGRLIRRAGDPEVSMLCPGLLVLVAFDPDAREELSLADDVLAVRATFVDPV